MLKAVTSAASDVAKTACAAKKEKCMSAGKIILIVVLLLVAVHLLLFGYLKRRIAAAKRDKGL